MTKSLILASSSPRRRSMLEKLDLAFRCESPQLVETRRENESPPAYARRLAGEKASCVLDPRNEDTVVLAADTVVFLGERILMKPTDESDAVKTLEILSGRTHKVVTGVTVASEDTMRQTAVVTSVRFRKLSRDEIEWYVASGEPLDKAGAYAIQGIGSSFIERIEGSPSNVVGLPLTETLQMLQATGIAPSWKRRKSE